MNLMAPKLLLRMSSVIMVLHAVGHTIGIATWTSEKSQVPKVVIEAMKNNDFVFQQAPATMAKFYEGMGYAATIALLFLSSVLWVASSVDPKNRRIAALFLWPSIAFMVLMGLDEIIYFFPMAAAFSLVSAGLTLTALVLVRRGQ